jgi:hypothetical protein
MDDPRPVESRIQIITSMLSKRVVIDQLRCCKALRRRPESSSNTQCEALNIRIIVSFGRIFRLDSGLRRNDEQNGRHRESSYFVVPAAALYRSPPDAALRRTQKTLAKIEAAQQQFHGQT